MKNIYMSRNGRTEYTRKEIAKALADLNSCECGDIHGQGAAVTYFIHVDDEGNILANMSGEEDCFIYTITCDEYGVDEEDWTETWDSSFIPEHEKLECVAFAAAVDELTDQVNAWIKENVEA